MMAQRAELGKLTSWEEHGLAPLFKSQSSPTPHGESFHPEKGRSHLQQAWGWVAAQMLGNLVLYFC